MKVTMTITVNTKAYNEDAATSKNSVPYMGPAQSVSVRDQIILARTPPEPNKTYSGTARASARLVRTLTLTGAVTPTGLGTVETICNFPVGSSLADQQAMILDHRTGLGQQWFEDLAVKHDLKA
jgi:hypothetical protein